MSSQSHRRTRPLATALLALALTTPAAPAIAAGNTPGHAWAAHRLRSTLVLLAALFVLGGVPTSAVARSRPIPVEPKVAYASYWGGSGAEGCGPTRGADGSLYVACGTDSPNLPRVGGIQS
jgi:hypothetical protein